MYFATIYGATLLLICSQLKESWARSLSLSLNLSLTLNDDEHPHLTLEILRSCMKQTQLSMSELKSDRVGMDFGAADLQSDLARSSSDNEADAEPTEATDDHVAGSEINHYDEVGGTQGERSNETYPDESLHCFTHCLYEQLGYYKNGIYDRKLLRKLSMSVQREEPTLQECMNLDSVNKCEATFKVHLCYNKLKSLDAERRLRQILKIREYAVLAEYLGERDTVGDNAMADSKSNEIEGA